MFSLWNRRQFGKALLSGSCLLGGVLQSQGAPLVVKVNQIESDDPVDMSAVKTFERVGDFSSPLRNPDEFWLAVRSVLKKSSGQLDLSIKKPEISPDRKVFHAYRLQAKCIEYNPHNWGIFSQKWEVWVQFLIRQMDEEGSGLKVIDVMMAVGERPDSNSSLQELKNYKPAYKLGKQLLKALENGMTSV